MRRRERLRDENLDAGARNWLVRTAKKNLWRVAAWYDLDELISDGVLCWQIVLSKYPRVSQRKHLMSLFQRTYINHIHQLANKRTAQVPEASLEIECEELFCEDSELRQFACSAPADVRECLLAIIDHPELLNKQRLPDGRRMTTNEWLCSFAGIDPSAHDLRSKLKMFLSS